VKYFSRVLSSSPLKADFIALCKTDATTAEIRAWIQRQPEFAGCYIPEELRLIRRDLGCSAAWGGKRSVRGEIAYTVAGRNRRQ
jgi:hypothetical protein